MKKTSVIIALLAITAVARGGAGGGSPLDRFSTEQRQKLLAGEVVYEYVIYDKGGDKGLGRAQALAIINSLADKCLDIMIRFDLKYEYFPRMIKSEIVKTEGNRYWVHEVLDLTITDVEYVNILTVDRDKLRVDYVLDPAYPHDLAGFSGFYYFESLGDGRSLITYAISDTDVGVPVPEFIVKALTSRDLPGLVENARKRIESGGKWKKPS